MDLHLFDLDGVLLNSAGYHRSFQEAVRHIARGLGFGDVTLTRDDIELFEALDITAEWDSAALCAALMLEQARRADPAASLPERLPVPERPPHGLPLPDFPAFLREVEQRHEPGRDPVATSLDVLRLRLDGSSGPDGDILEVARRARDPSVSLTFQLVQLFNLGTVRFETLYETRTGIQTESCLEQFDQPTLSASEHAALRRSLEKPDVFGAIITNRPSPSSGGIFDTPEAEIGARVAGLTDVPRITSGELGALAAVEGLDPEAFLKPSPIHLLAGMQAALGAPAEESVRWALSFTRSGDPDGAWTRLHGARLCVYEDAAKGLLSAAAARDELRRRGIETQLELFGIAATPVRTDALARTGARIFPHVRQALDEAMPGWNA